MKRKIDLTAFFPPLYARWMGELLQGPIPEEREATCRDCAMCRKPGLGPGMSTVYFKPGLKCCTYRPLLPNYLVGRVLLEEGPAFAAGRATVEARIAAGVAVTPAGLSSNPKHAELYEQSPSGFGRDPRLLCPHHVDEDGGKCGIWNNRNGVCATYFCKYNRGAVGAGFWNAVQPLLTTVEKVLAHWCLLELGLEAEALRTLFPHRSHIREAFTPSDVSRSDGTLDAAKYRAVWGQWHGQEHDFYRACARRVDKLRFSQVVKLGGPEVALAAHLARHAYARLFSSTLPKALVPGRYVRLPAGADRSELFADAHSRYDPLELPNAVLAALPLFEGRTTEEALRAAKEQGVEIGPALLQRLVDFGVLVPRSI